MTLAKTSIPGPMSLATDTDDPAAGKSQYHREARSVRRTRTVSR